MFLGLFGVRPELRFAIKDLIKEPGSDESMAKLERLVFKKRALKHVNLREEQAPAIGAVAAPGSAASSASTLLPTPPPFPPPPPPPPVVHVSVAQPAGPQQQGAGGGLSETDIAVLDSLAVDEQARHALGVLSAVDPAAKNSLIFKLVMKSATALRNPSAFIMQCSLNAMRQHNMA